MTFKKILRTTLAVLVASMLVAAPAAAAVPDRPAESGPTTRSLVLGELLSRAWALLLGEWAAEREDAGERDPISPQSMSDANEEDSGSDLDPDG